ncbi:Fc.00g090040.m01.CDS01 [Cosmosporella sp. VM-42]
MPSAHESTYLNVRLESRNRPLVLRSVRLEDASAMSRLSELIAAGSGRPYSEAECRDQIKHMMACALTPTVTNAQYQTISGPLSVNLVILDKSEGDKEGKVIGACGIDRMREVRILHHVKRIGNFNIMLDPAYKDDHHLAETVMGLMLDWAFAQASRGGLQLQSVEFQPLADHVVMLRLIRDFLKLSFEGASRKGTDATHSKKFFFWEFWKQQWYVKNWSG